MAHIRKNASAIIYLTSSAILLLLAYLAWTQLALALFQHALSNFYNVAPEVTEQCTTVVKDAVVAFTGVYDLIADICALVIFVLACLFFVIAIRSALNVNKSLV